MRLSRTLKLFLSRLANETIDWTILISIVGVGLAVLGYGAYWFGQLYTAFVPAEATPIEYILGAMTMGVIVVILVKLWKMWCEAAETIEEQDRETMRILSKEE